ncbi:hypothetical protein M758_3G014100 [Ceratodon purpureus]|nr:hypothetical protein M758_3G014100 [Ceratodon purpureus]
MDDETVRSVTEAVENAVKYCTAAVEQAVTKVTSGFESSAGAIEGDAQNISSRVQSILESANEDVEGGLKSTIVASCKRVPSGGWFLLSLGMAGMLIARGEKKRCGKSPHPSICHCIQLQPPAFYFDQPLKNRRFCAQDIFDVEAAITSFGSPHWEKTHEAATKTAFVLDTLKKRGATCIAKTVMDELGFSLVGRNRWFETPRNPFAIYRICGGSSSGAAVSVANEIAEFAIGIDTVGDIRVPAACCGVLGFRASHGAVSMAGIIPVASSCDALGWFARNADLLLLVGRQLCTPHSEADGSGPKRFYMARDVFKLSCLPHSGTADIMSRSVERTIGRLSLHDIELLDHFKFNMPAIQTFKKELDRMNIESSQYTTLDVLRESMLLFHRHEFKTNHGEWVAKVKPQLTCTVEARVERAVFTPSSAALRSIAGKVREELRTVMDTLLKVVIPVGSYGCPMSVSLLARKGADLLLLETVFVLHTTVQQEVLMAANPTLPITSFINRIR